MLLTCLNIENYASSDHSVILCLMPSDTSQLYDLSNIQPLNITFQWNKKTLKIKIQLTDDVRTL